MPIHDGDMGSAFDTEAQERRAERDALLRRQAELDERLVAALQEARRRHVPAPA